MRALGVALRVTDILTSIQGSTSILRKILYVSPEMTRNSTVIILDEATGAETERDWS